MDGAPDLVSLFAMAAEEARRLGYSGTLRVDAGALHVGDLGPMVIPAPVLARLEARRSPSNARSWRVSSAGSCGATLPLDGRYDELKDPEVRARLQRNLFAIESEPERPRPWNAVGRVERALAVDGWQHRLRRAAELYAAQAARRHAEDQHAANSDIDAANMYRLAGMAAESRHAAETALGRLDPGRRCSSPVTNALRSRWPGDAPSWRCSRRASGRVARSALVGVRFRRGGRRAGRSGVAAPRARGGRASGRGRGDRPGRHQPGRPRHGGDPRRVATRPRVVGPIPD